jgi:hypothetical protein
MKNINKELYRLKKLKQAEKKLAFLELFQSLQPLEDLDENYQINELQKISNQQKQQYKLPDSKSPFIPQLGSPKPKYDPVSFHTEEEKQPEMSRAMESFLIQQEKERKEKEQQKQQQKEYKSHSSFFPSVSSSDQKGMTKKEREEDKNLSQKSNPRNLNEKQLTNTEEKGNMESKEKAGSLDSKSAHSPLSFAGLRQSGPTRHSQHYTSSDPEIPYGAYNENGPYPHYVSSFGRSSGATLEGQQRKSDEKSRGPFFS